MVQAILQFRGVVLNLLFVGYIWLLQPPVLQRMSARGENGQADWWIGGLLLVLPLIEMLGLFLKRPLYEYFSWHFPRRDGGNWSLVIYLLTAMFHIGMSAMLAIIAFQTMGIWGEGEAALWLQCLAFIIFFLILAKEAVFVTVVLNTSGLPIHGRVDPVSRALVSLFNAPLLPEIRLPDALREVLGDLLLLAYAMLAYTVLWEFVAVRSPFHGEWIEYLGATLYFFMIWLSVQAVYILQGLQVQSSPSQLWLERLSLLAVWFVALSNIPRS